MWAIRFLTGPQSGQIYPLKSGKTSLGRSPMCEIKVNSNGVSKEHAQIFITEDKVILSDLNSRNGTYVNGIRIQNQSLRIGDKISLHDVIFDILNVPDATLLPGPSQAVAHSGFERPRHMVGHFDGNAAVRSAPHPQEYIHTHGASDGAPVQNHAGNQFSPPSSFKDLIANLQSYIDNVAMPGVYKVAQMVDFRTAIGLALLIYTFTVTLLATMPMVSSIKTSIQAESERRALTIARYMAHMNRQAILQNQDVSVSVEMAKLEHGVDSAFIISSNDGHIIAPANLRNTYADKPFVNTARHRDKESVEFINDSLVGASVPITHYDPRLGVTSVAAHAIVIYDMGSLAFNATDAFSLFIKIFATALLFGLALFFLLFKLVEHPIVGLNSQLDEALKEGRVDIRSEYRNDAMEALAANITSALSRIDSSASGGAGHQFSHANRDIEAANLVQIVGVAAVTVNAIDQQIVATNDHFDYLIGGSVGLGGRALAEIPDSALQLNIQDIISRLRATPDQVASSEIPFSGETFEVRGQAIMSGSEPAYFLICIQQLEIEGGHHS